MGLKILRREDDGGIKIVIPDGRIIKLNVNKILYRNVELDFVFPEDVKILRHELWQKIQDENKCSAPSFCCCPICTRKLTHGIYRGTKND